MNNELLDSEFYKRKELPARDWWEKRRNLFNKFCAISIAIIFIITFILFFNNPNNLIAGLAVCVFYSLIFITFCNIAYSGVWILEDLFVKVFSIKIKHEIRIITFRIIIFILFLPAILYLLLMII